MISIQSIKNKIAHMRAANGRFAIGKEEFFGTLTDITEKLQEVNDNTNSVAKSLIWQSPVASVPALATTYPNPQRGWAAMVESEGLVYSFNGEAWKNTGLTAFPRDVELKSRTYTQLTDPALDASNGVKNGDTWIYTGTPLMRYDRLDGIWVSISDASGEVVGFGSGVGYSRVPAYGTAEESGSALAAEIARVGALGTRHTIFLDDAVYHLATNTTIKGNITIKTISGRRGATLMCGDSHSGDFLIVKSGAEFQGVLFRATLINSYNSNTGDVEIATGLKFKQCKILVGASNVNGQVFAHSKFHKCEINIQDMFGQRISRITNCDFYDCECTLSAAIVEGCNFKGGTTSCQGCHFASNSCFGVKIGIEHCEIDRNTTERFTNPSNLHGCFIDTIISVDNDMNNVFCYSCYFSDQDYDMQICTRYGCFVKDAEMGLGTYKPTVDIFNEH